MSTPASLPATTNWVDKECKDTIYITPEKVLAPIRRYFGGPIPLDAATEKNNPTKALQFFTIEDNALVQTWLPPTFVNPPFGGEIVPFMKKIHEEAVRDRTRPILALLPCGARFSTKYWQAHALVPELHAICFVKGRVKFLRPDGSVAKQNPYDSQIYGYNIDIKTFNDSFKDLGKCVYTSILP